MSSRRQQIAAGLLAAAALVVAAWFALGVREAHEVSQATSIVSASSHLTPAEARHVRSLLSGAAPLNPDRELDILRGRVAAEGGSNAAADRILFAVTRAEPMNLEAWAWIGRLAANHRVLLDAYGHIALLAPQRKQ